ncbi:uncharacterized protein LOC119184550 [Rhipicephalus microplus]|uniref:uncharacterized protein LOC119184550 n=1 Tax=Rhipicephalus microplus TaxID=6941 RepID=UPI003F6D8011
MSRSVLGQPISKRQRGSFGEASLLLGHLIDSASRLKPHIFRWRSFTAVAHIPFIYLCRTYGPQSEGFNRGVYRGVQQQQCGCREKRRQRFRRCGRRGKRHRGSHRQARDATAKTQAQAAGHKLPGVWCVRANLQQPLGRATPPGDAHGSQAVLVHRVRPPLLSQREPHGPQSDALRSEALRVPPVSAGVLAAMFAQPSPSKNARERSEVISSKDFIVR